MAYGRRDSSIFDSFSLSPLPYPVIFILLITILLLAVSWSFTYEDVMERAEEQVNWLLLATPVALLLLIRWISSFDSFDFGLFGYHPYDRRRRWGGGGGGGGQGTGSEGSSPWGVAAVVLLLLVLVSFQSTFQDMWRP